MKSGSRFLKAAFLASTVGALSACTYNVVSQEPDPVLSDIFNKAVAYHVSSPSPASLRGKSIDELLASLDAHSRYLPPEEYSQMSEEQLNGRFDGVGIEVAKDKDSSYIRVITPIDDTPAARAGMKPGDIIMHLNGRSLRNESLEDVISQMRGAPGSQVTLTLQREGESVARTLTLTRDTIKLSTVKSAVIGNDVGYIRISAFNGETENSLFSEFVQLRTDLGDRARGYVIDLRNNPGGLLLQAIDVADDFLDDGEIVSVGKARGGDGESRNNNQSYSAYYGDISDRKPIIILINEGTASAAEILAGALQDHGRAIILGTRSFGKGSVQTIFPLFNGGALALTTAHYFTPSGDSIQGRGITPDIKFIPADESDRSFKREADYENSLANPGTESDARLTTQICRPSLLSYSFHPDPDAMTIDGQIDYQLLCAVEKLQGKSLYTRLTAIDVPRPDR